MTAALHGIGIDILRVERMEKLLEKHGDKLLTRLLCAQEQREVRTRKNRARALAMCWAAKEAFVKALGTGFDGIGWKEVGVVREANGRPVLVFDRVMKARMKRQNIGAAHISLSDDGGMVSAYVVLERAPPSPTTVRRRSPRS
ncbi:holo-ACP synthase [Solimonas marina]|uniref:Holo-[acyl-carrier-protein] synthase n=1 Tax=Solimonas marina TaxID=2714601 RepID=A0A970B815_9GAMM|nr:holo-ACP synthase [Solimonas marina]NKF21804.1 holo-ACP synthase [Solimonas marina]